MSSITIATSDGDVEIQEHELPTLTEEELRNFGISREDLNRCFAEGVELMRGVEPGKRVRPIAQETLDGEWLVRLVGYSAVTDPLMNDPPQGSA